VQNQSRVPQTPNPKPQTPNPKPQTPNPNFNQVKSFNKQILINQTQMQNNNNEIHFEGRFGDVNIKDNIATKTLKHYTTERDLIHIFREIYFGLHCKHPNIVPITGINIKTNENATEIENISLEQPNSGINLIQFKNFYKGNMPLLFLKTIMYQLFRGLYYLHINEIMHRDLHLGNVLINLKTFEVKIIDLGWAKKMKIDENTVLVHANYIKNCEEFRKRSLKPSYESEKSSECKSISSSEKKPVLLKRQFEEFKNKIKIIDFREDQKKKINPERILPSMVPDYMTKIYNNKADVFAAGQLFYFLISGQHYYKKCKSFHTIIKISQGLLAIEDVEFEKLLMEHEQFEIIDQLTDEQICQEGKDLLKNCLQFYEKDRFTSTHVLKHNYFKPLNEGFVKRNEQYPKVLNGSLLGENINKQILIEKILDLKMEFDDKKNQENNKK
jgi:serine/threonine protein kinase